MYIYMETKCDTISAFKQRWNIGRLSIFHLQCMYVAPLDAMV